MKSDEIKKALDVLKSWQYLAYHNDDGTDEDSHELYKALTLVFDFINRQKAEIERLQTENRILSQKRFNIFERLEFTNKIRAKAIKELAERLCEDRLSNDPVVIAVKTELKLMEGETK